MPILQVKISPPQHPDTYARLAESLSRLTAQHLGKQFDVTAVDIEERLVGRWYIGGELPQAATFFLDISITAGTNTEADKAQFIAAVYANVQQQIGGGKPLAQASYIAVHEVPATDWGYGGQTQQARRLARTAQAQAALQAK